MRGLTSAFEGEADLSILTRGGGHEFASRVEQVSCTRTSAQTDCRRNDGEQEISHFSSLKRDATAAAILPIDDFMTWTGPFQGTSRGAFDRRKPPQSSAKLQKIGHRETDITLAVRTPLGPPTIEQRDEMRRFLPAPLTTATVLGLRQQREWRNISMVLDWWE